VDLIEGFKRRPSLTEINVRQGHYALEINLDGTQLMRESEQQPWRVLPPMSVALVRGPASVVVHVGRGNHRSFLISWSEQELPGLARWIEKTSNERKMARRFAIVAFNPVTSVGGDVAQKTVHALEEVTPMSEPMMLADNEFCLATLPANLPETMKPLVENVKIDPAASWSLKEASALAGYSPFHLSRTFKAIVGYGFPEFVDRCRTEIAVVQLCNTDRGIDEIASNCGFGSPQALRESVKEYLGMLPSELRIQAGTNSLD
jgi:AraC-like DNA-binding protein